MGLYVFIIGILGKSVSYLFIKLIEIVLLVVIIYFNVGSEWFFWGSVCIYFISNCNVMGINLIMFILFFLISWNSFFECVILFSIITRPPQVTGFKNCYMEMFEEVGVDCRKLKLVGKFSIWCLVLIWLRVLLCCIMVFFGILVELEV